MSATDVAHAEPSASLRPSPAPPRVRSPAARSGDLVGGEAAPPLAAARAVLAVGWLAAAGALALTVVLDRLPPEAAIVVAAGSAVAMLALGTPHGALDHLTVARSVRLTGSAASRSSAAGTSGADRGRGDGRLASLLATMQQGTSGLSPRFTAGYLGCAAVALAGYLLAPTVGFAAFLALSVAHFAAGEAGVAIERRLASGWRDPLAWAAASGGAAVVVLPLASPEAGSAVAAVDPRLAPVLGPLPAIAAGTVVVAVAALLTCAVVARAGGGRARAAAVVAGELTGLVVLALLAHPLLAFAAYYGAWHAFRHQARLASVLEREAGVEAGIGLSAGGPLRRVVRSAAAGLPATVAVLGAAIALAVAGQSLLGGLLAVVWALTVPHTVAVAAFELRRARQRRAHPEGRSTRRPHDTEWAVTSTPA